jgi:hypothetical protein
MYDHATRERTAWLERIQAPKRPPNWVLHPRYSPKGDERVDAEIRARLQRVRAARCST